MRKVLEIILNRFRMSINIFFFSFEERRKKKKFLWGSLLFGIIVTTVIFIISMLVTHLIVKILVNNLNLLIITDQVKWLSIFFLAVILNVVFYSLKSSITRFIQSEDNSVLLVAPLSIKEYIFARIFERFLLKIVVLTLFIVIPVGINIFLVIKPNFLVSLIGVLVVLSVLFLGNVTRIIVICLAIRNIVLEKRILLYNFLSSVIFALNILIILFLINPFLIIFPSSNFKNTYLSLINIYPFDLLIKGISSSFLPHNWAAQAVLNASNQNYFKMAIDLFGFMLFIFVVIVVTMKILKNYEEEQTLTLLNNYKQSKNVYRTWNKLINLFDNSIGWLNNQTRAILVKDFRSTLRDKKYKWIPVLLVILLSFGTSLGIYIYVIKQTKGVFLNPTMIGVTLEIFSLNFTVFALMDRFSIDAEGKNFFILLTSPVKASRIVFAKIIAVILFAFPVSIVFSTILNLTIQANWLLLVFGSLVSIPTIAIMTLTACSTFPNFEYNSLLDLPTTKAKILSNFLNSLYLVFVGVILFSIENYVLSLLVFTGLSCAVSWILFYASCKQISESEMESFHSIREIWS